jgi:predicted Zn-ribbon and HTH transcriptional regulator
MVSLDKSIKAICKVLQFADDVAIYTIDTSPDEALTELENSARELSQHHIDRGLQLAPEKCKLCIFRNKRS